MENQKIMFTPYKIVFAPGEGEYEEKKSRFIAHVAPAESEEEAAEFIERMRNFSGLSAERLRRSRQQKLSLISSCRRGNSSTTS